MLLQALRNIYRKKFNATEDIEPHLFHEFTEIFNQAADEGFLQSVEPDEEFRKALRHNNAVFAAFKTHRMQNDMAAQLLDSNGNLKPFEQWKNDIQSIASHQCRAWLQTEYNTAVLRAHQAADWQQFLQEADVLPNLKWMPSTSPNPGADHMPFWGTILPIDDPFWDQHRPGDRWNCKCSLTSTDEPTTPVPSVNSSPKGGGREGAAPQRGLENNPGKDAKLFAASHPYIANAYPGAKDAVKKVVNEMEGVYKEVATKQGRVRIHPKHGKNEVLQNTDIAVFLADKHAYDIELLPKIEGQKSADTYNHTLQKKQEYKVNATASYNSIDRLIRDAKNQADSIVLRIDSEITLGTLRDAVQDRVNRARNITDITLIQNGKDVTYTREQIIDQTFKIQPEDFK